MSNRIPVTVITGFLGAGKTTVLRHLLLESNLKLAVMINEFGSVGLDGDLMKTCGFCTEEEIDGRIVELNNGCLCCTVQDDFLPTIEKLLLKSNLLDGIVIETSGLALPRPLIQAIEWPEIKSKIYLNAVVTLVDSFALSQGSPVGDLLALEKQRQEDESLDHITPINELFHDQLSASDIVLMSRSDLLSQDSLSSIKTDLQSKVFDGTRILPISNGIVDPSIILDSKINTNSYRLLEHDTSNDHDHHHVEVFSNVLRLEAHIDQHELEKLLTDICEKYQLLRVKGRLWQQNKKLPLQVQMVGRRISTWFEKAPEDSWKPTDAGLDLVVLSLKDGATNAISDSFS